MKALRRDHGLRPGRDDRWLPYTALRDAVLIHPTLGRGAYTYLLIGSDGIQRC